MKATLPRPQAVLLFLLAGSLLPAGLAVAQAPPPASEPAATTAPPAAPAAAPAKKQPSLDIQQTKIYRQSAEAAQGAFAFYGTLDRPQERQRVLEIGYRIAAVSEFTDFPFSFYLVDMPVPNAFALPGGHIFVTRGMLDLGLSDDMLACLLGHEVAHVIERHGQRIQRRATLLNVLSQAALLGVMIGAEDKPSDVYNPYAGPEESRKGTMVQGTFAAGIVFTELLLRKYSREFEDEADDHGQRLAAAAGYDPIGAKQLWQTMMEKIPQSEDYGYWRTHPFSEVRLRAAAARAAELGRQKPGSADAYRQEAQRAILAYRDKVAKESSAKDFPEEEPKERPTEAESKQAEAKRKQKELEASFVPFLEASALDTWPSGETAEKLRLARLHRLRERELAREEMSRDYGELLRAYEKEAAEVRALTAESPFLATLDGEQKELRGQSEALYPKALAIWQEGIYQTPFLETFVSNWPAGAESAEMALALGNAYARSKREADSVEQFLRAAAAGPDDPVAAKALTGLRNLAPHLQNLVALARLAESSLDPQLRELAAARLEKVAPTFAELENGSAFVKEYGENPQVPVVRKRIEALAQNLYGEVVLYQSLGDPVKALERIQKILEHAPLTPAAEALRQKALGKSGEA